MPAPLGAAQWGLGRSLRAEHGEIWGGLIDVSLDHSADLIANHLIREIEAATIEDKVAYRGLHRYVPRLVRHFAEQEQPSSSFRVSPTAAT